MILIISNEYDRSTTEVMQWLNYHSIEHFRINTSSEVQLLEFEISNNNTKFCLEILDNFGRKKINSEEITAVWYRRGALHINPRLNIKANELFSYFNNEQSKIVEYLFYLFDQTALCINHPRDNNINKLVVLDTARQMGLLIPETFIYSQSNNIINLSKKKRLISKSIDRPFVTNSRGRGFSSLTQEFTRNDLESDRTLWPSLVQEMVIKKYELRIFFILNAFFASAIFSQQDKQTAIDFRNYNKDKPNRVVPYKLPTNISTKLTNLMKTLSLASGSIDMIVDSHDNFIFLEVNPIGQFSQVSIPCSYYLEELLALKLHSYE